MPKAGSSRRAPTREPSSEVDELADDPSLQPAPPASPLRAAVSKGKKRSPAVKTVAPAPPGSRATKPYLTRKTSAQKPQPKRRRSKAEDAEPSTALTALERFRFKGAAVAKLDPNTMNDPSSPGPSGPSEVKRPPKRLDPANASDPSPALALRRKRSSTAASLPDESRENVTTKRRRTEPVFVIPDFDEDGNPVETERETSPSPAASASTSAKPSAALYDANPRQLQSPPPRPQTSTLKQLTDGQAPALSAQTSPLRQLPSSIELPTQLAIRLMRQPDKAENAHPASEPAEVGARPPPSSASAHLTNEQQQAVDEMMADLEGMDADAFQELEETHEREESAGGAGQAVHEAAGEDPDKTLVDPPLAEIDALVRPDELAEPASAQTVTQPTDRADSTEGAPDVTTAHAQTADTASSASPPHRLQVGVDTRSPVPVARDFSPSRLPTSPAQARLASPQPLHRPITPPRPPPAYRLVPFSIDGLVSHLREVVSASSSTSTKGGSFEVEYLRGEVSRLIGQLEERDEVVKSLAEQVRDAERDTVERDEREKAWQGERKALERKVDVLREIRRGLLGQVKELEGRVEALETALASTEQVEEGGEGGTANERDESSAAGQLEGDQAAQAGTEPTAPGL
ncbi:hypothetical protein JCM10296v2_003934 [Rhodotorula toruloides]